MSPAPRATVRAFPDAHGAATDAAQLMAAGLRRAAETRPDGRLGLALSGGGTPVEAYEQLGALVPDWSRVDLFLADERCVPQDHEDSNAKLVRESLAAPGSTLHPLVEVGTPADRARAYAKDLDGHVLDVALLGIGEDGHTCSLFPNHGALEAEGTTVGVVDSPKPPPERVSLTLPALAAAGELILLVAGEGKAAAVAAALGEPDPHVPASLLRRDTLTIVADEAALSEARAAGLLDA